ncbi:MAG: ferrous iron transport protein B [Saprospiraceae bacterium]|nr:ferrous iron transport protein B [Saprospiraceae bacterium]
MSKLSNIAIVGNPNSGKSTIFNLLTGLQQKVGNFAGVTVEKLEGIFRTFQKDKIRITDLPGAYSLHTTSKDEKILSQCLLDTNINNKIDGIIYVADLRYLHQQLLLLTQILDLNYPTMIVLSNMDQVDDELALKWQKYLEQKTNCISHAMSSRLAYSVIHLKEKLNEFIYKDHNESSKSKIYQIPNEFLKDINKLKNSEYILSDYHAYLKIIAYSLEVDNQKYQLDKSEIIPLQIAETMSRYSIIENWESQINLENKNSNKSFTHKLDQILTHPIWGLGIFFTVMFLVFQMMYSWAEFPMTAIEDAFAYTADSIKKHLPTHWISQLITDGLIPGLAGVMVFVPQIVFLFLMLTLLEEAGYMTRVVYLLDHILAKFGLNGRSIIGLISGAACAIPAIMSTRSIFNRKERLITSFVIPLIPCSARIPVYTALIGFVVPHEKIWNIFNLQGIVFMGLYLLGIVMALLIALIMSKFLSNNEQSFLLMQLPNYQIPQFKLVATTIFNKVKSFVIEAGKVIIVISVILWFLSSFSWPGEFKKVENDLQIDQTYLSLPIDEKISLAESKKLEHSFAGKIGKFIEPVIQPLGFDWKIGIALITSFAAREVFVGTMSTIYSIGDNSDEARLREVLSSTKRSDGTKFFNMKTALSLILFYAFAMQCMSTLAIMKRETGGWRVPILQFLTFGILAYLSSLLVYQLL